MPDPPQDVRRLPAADPAGSAGSFVLGLDPGTTTGLAAVARGARSTPLFVESATPLETIERLTAWAGEGTLAGAYVEDARELPIYARHGGKNRGERDRVARSVGGVDTLTTIYVELLTSLGVPVATVEPVKAAKWDAETCERLTGWRGRSNQHGRDALRIVFGRGVPRPLLSTPERLRVHLPLASRGLPTL